MVVQRSLPPENIVALQQRIASLKYKKMKSDKIYRERKGFVQPRRGRTDQKKGDQNAQRSSGHAPRVRRSPMPAV